MIYNAESGLSEEMQPQAAPSSSCWRNFHHVQNITALGVQWLFGCLPCVKGHHRIHPTILESPDALYIAIDKKKRLRVLHVVPDSDVSSISGKTCVFDQVDFEECCTLDSSGEDYWFMRWSRPIRPNLQRNSCGCSFRRSQIKSSSDLKDLKSNENNNENPVGDEVDRATFPSQTLLEESLAGGLCMLAEKLAQDILKEAVKRSCKIKIKNVSKIKQGNNLNHCDTDCVKNVERNVEKSKVEFSGYINPVFIASSDELNLSSQNSTFEDSCDTSNFSAVIINEDSSMKEFQDCNANDQNQYAVAEKNARNKYDLMSSKEELGYKKRHRKSCLSGSKTYLQKPLLLLIHGAGSNCEVWHNLISHLVRGGYECVAPDLLGHGLSSAPDKASCYTFHSFLQDLLCIFDRFVVEGRTAVILGHGYGCSLAAAIARYRPEQVIQLVLISGGGPTPLAPRNPPSVSLCLRACLEPLLMCGFKRDVVYSVCGKQMEPLSPEISGVPRHIVDHISQGHVWPEGDAAFHRRIVSPTLLVHGMKDPHITLVQQCEMERTIPRSFLEVIPEAGHWSMLETPSHLSHMILCFIDWWAPTQ